MCKETVNNDVDAFLSNLKRLTTTAVPSVRLPQPRTVYELLSQRWVKSMLATH